MVLLFIGALFFLWRAYDSYKNESVALTGRGIGAYTHFTYKAKQPVRYYCLLLGEAILGVACLIIGIVIILGIPFFAVNTTLNTNQAYSSNGMLKQLDYSCKELQLKSLPCGCYLCDSSQGEVNSSTQVYESAGKSTCDNLANKTQNSYERWTGRCG